MKKTFENADPNEVWAAACERAKRHVAISHFELRGEVAIEMAIDLLGIAHQLHGVACPACMGRGQRAYASTSTWHGGIGGSAITDDICDVCWGTGRTDRTGANLRELTDRREDK